MELACLLLIWIAVTSILNNSDDQIIPECKETSKVNNKDEDEDVSESIKTRDTNKQSDTQPLFNHVIISNNLNVETILNQFKELIVKPRYTIQLL